MSHRISNMIHGTRKFILVAPALIFGALAIWAADSPPKQWTTAQKRWWSLQPVKKPQVPAPSGKWGSNAIDLFVIEKMSSKQLQPSHRADKATLIRRVTLDLTGLLPTPQQVRDFELDTRPDAYERLVDGLLSSKTYGETWARHWLDLARYSDSEGFKADETRPNIWRYRDYVIDSFNQDKPYDRFVKEQIAGDQLYPDDPNALVAMGFHRHFADESDARDMRQRRQEMLNDITDTVSLTFMGLTMGCARCHDHKFDPITHKDYYKLQAFFSNVHIVDNAPLIAKDKREEWMRKKAVWDEKTATIRAEINKLLEPIRAKELNTRIIKYPPEVQRSLTIKPEERTPIEWQLYYKAVTQIPTTEAYSAKSLKGENLEKYKELRAEISKFDSIRPADLPVAQVMLDHNGPPPETHVLAGGGFDQPREEVKPGFLDILGNKGPAPGEQSRVALANWLASPDNPLTARVMVNRVWMQHFGRGIAPNPSDLGLMGGKVSHPELLDYLTATFVEDGWSLKKLHRLIVTSETYRQQSAPRETAMVTDPENMYLWRFTPRRLDSEVIRDTMLETSGLLSLKMSGPGVFPPIPASIEPRGGWNRKEDPVEAARRSIYIFVRRNNRYPMMEVFDMPDTNESCGRRQSTTTAPQSLELLNNPLVLDWAQALARRISNDGGVTPEAQASRALSLAYARPPTEQEKLTMTEFLKKQSKITGDPMKALTDLAQMLFSSNQFLNID